MGVAAGGGQAGMADRRLHQMRRRTAVERVADMGMAQPVGRNCRRRTTKTGVRAHCLQLGNTDLTGAAGEMIMGMLNTFTEFERDLFD